MELQFDVVALGEFYCEATEVPSTHIKTFIDTYVGNATLYVPEASVNIYKNTAPWSAFGNILPIPATDISNPLIQSGKPDCFILNSYLQPDGLIGLIHDDLAFC